MREGIHDGHRERLINKFLEYPDSFSDHELMEMFLFPIVPRKDTNAVAHRLLNAFGGLKEVFSAGTERLMTVNGVGEKTAAYIALNGKLLKKVASDSGDKTLHAFSSPEKAVGELRELFIGLKTERFYFLLLDSRYRKVFQLEFTDADDGRVAADSVEIARAMSLHGAKFAIMAHNHPSGICKPSAADDAATVKFDLLCKMHGVKLIDHVICSSASVFSYFGDGRLNYIREKSYAEKLFDGKE